VKDGKFSFDWVNFIIGFAGGAIFTAIIGRL
jgi:hypothetical protein